MARAAEHDTNPDTSEFESGKTAPELFRPLADFATTYLLEHLPTAPGATPIDSDAAFQLRYIQPDEKPPRPIGLTITIDPRSAVGASESRTAPTSLCRSRRDRREGQLRDAWRRTRSL
jgi:hypothetical protein